MTFCFGVLSFLFVCKQSNNNNKTTPTTTTPLSIINHNLKGGSGAFRAVFRASPLG
jgi:hypothetical protein